LNYDKAKINLGYSYIYSPIDGVVLSRAVDEGQTVAASFSTPTLFSIANDLTRMQVEASIDEADIGQVKNGQRVEFTVDAYSEQKFSGVVTQIRLKPVTTSNVVTYTVIVEAPNPDKKLMPGMTASITIFTEEANNVLVVASKALRFKPDEVLLAEYLKKYPGKEQPNTLTNDSAVSKPESRDMNNKQASQGSREHLTDVWVKVGDNIHSVKLVSGINNDMEAQVISGLKEGDEVVVSLSAEGEQTMQTPAATSSPFMPKMPSKTSAKKN
jgi:HlyD family secretion protein